MIDRVVREHRDFLVRLVTGWTRNRCDAEDVVQEALGRVAAFPDPDVGRPLLVKYCRWAWLQSLRDRSTAKRAADVGSLDSALESDPDLPVTGRTLEEDVLVREALEVVKEALVFLTPTQRSAVLRAAAGFAVELDDQTRRALARSAYRGRLAMADYLRDRGYDVNPTHSVLDDVAWRRVA